MTIFTDLTLRCTCGQHVTCRVYTCQADGLLVDWLRLHQGAACCPTAMKGTLAPPGQDALAWAWVDAQLAKIDQWIAERRTA